MKNILGFFPFKIRNLFPNLLLDEPLLHKLHSSPQKLHLGWQSQLFHLYTSSWIKYSVPLSPNCSVALVSPNLVLRQQWLLPSSSIQIRPDICEGSREVGKMCLCSGHSTLGHRDQRSGSKALWHILLLVRALTLLTQQVISLFSNKVEELGLEKIWGVKLYVGHKHCPLEHIFTIKPFNFPGKYLVHKWTHGVADIKQYWTFPHFASRNQPGTTPDPNKWANPLSPAMPSSRKAQSTTTPFTRESSGLCKMSLDKELKSSKPSDHELPNS